MASSIGLMMDNSPSGERRKDKRTPLDKYLDTVAGFNPSYVVGQIESAVQQAIASGDPASIEKVVVPPLNLQGAKLLDNHDAHNELLQIMHHILDTHNLVNAVLEFGIGSGKSVVVLGRDLRDTKKV